MLLMALLAPWAVAQQALPYSYGFEDNDLSTDGWELVGSTSSYTGINNAGTSTAHGGSYLFRFNYSERNAILMSPLLTGTNKGVALSFYYMESSNSYGDEQFYVGYTTDETNTDPTTFTYGSIVTASLSWQIYETTLPANVARIAIKYVYNDALYLYLDDFSFAAPASCTKPTDLMATLTQGDGTVATLDWTAGGTETDWVLEYGTASDFSGATSVNVSTRPTLDLTGLTPETTYYARVKADCGGGDQSDWCNDICTFTPSDNLAFTVNDGTSTNEYVPFYGYYADSNTDGLFIIPATSLASIQWGTITKLTFYVSSPASNTFTNSSGVSAAFEVYMTETSDTVISGTTISFDGMTKVLNATNLVINNNMMEITLDNPYEYLGGNLKIGFDETTNGGYAHTYWYGIEATGASLGGYGTTIAQKNFLPKTTFGYIPGTAPSCFKPTDLVVDTVMATSAILSWTENGAATAWVVAYSTDGVNFREVAATTNPFTLTGLVPETDYIVKVQANCGGGDLSNWSNEISFTTDELCHTPLYVGTDTVTATSTIISWNGIESTYTLRYAQFPSSKGASSHLKFADFIKNKDYKATDMAGTQVTASPNAQPSSYTNPGQTRDGWYYYDNGTCQTNFGYNGSMYWGVMFPAGTYTGNLLSKIAVWENDDNTNPITVFVCDGNTEPNNILYWEEFDVVAENDFHVVTLASPVDIDPTQNLWLIFTSSDNYPAAVSHGSTETDANGRWCSFDGSIWYDLADVGGDAYYAFMARAYTETFNPSSLTWITVPNITTNEYEITGLTPQTRYAAQVQANCGGSNGDSKWANTYFTTLPSCLTPTDLDSTAYSAHTVTLGWTENGDATEWDIEVAGPTTYIVNATTNPFTVSNLQDNTTYTFKVRAKCSDTDFSEWSNHVTVTTDIACYAPDSLAVTNIKRTSADIKWTSDASSCDLRYVAVPEDTNSGWVLYDNGTYSTSIGSSSSSTRTWGVMYPSSMLNSNTVLSALKFYETGSLESYVTINIYQGGDTRPERLIHTDVVNPLNAAGFHDVALSNAVTIDPTQNLWISLTATGVYPMPACTVNDANNRWVCHEGVWEQLTSSLADYGWMIRAYLGTMNCVTVSDLTTYQYTMSNLDVETTYLVQIRSNCEDVSEGYSWWSDIMFTTEEACPAPENLAATPYANSAVLNWDGISDSYTVSYRTAAYIEGTPEEFATTSVPTGWTRSNTQLTDDVLNGTTAIASYSGGWNFGTANGVFDNHARVNVYGTSCKYWLITPAITVPADATFSFDLALTAYNGTVAAPATTGTDDRFVVLISTDNKATWTILRQWDNAGSSYVYNNINSTATGENVRFDFSTYARDTVYIAFYGESTVSNADNNLHIDNVSVGTEIPAGTWETASAAETTLTLTGLTAETKYNWKVQGDCGAYGISQESAIASFTTTDDLCPVPTGLAVDTVTATTADLHWNGSPDVTGYNVRYRSPEYVTGGIIETFNTNGVPTGWTRYTGLVDEVVAGTATLSTTTSGWNPTNIALGAYNMKVNIYGTVKYWLVSPEVELISGSTLSFDLALTDYNNSDPIENDTLQADDRFVVLVYANNAWTILREWNNTGSSYVYNTIATTGENVNIDLTAYVGQTVKIAFYGESTVSGNGDNDMHIDNVTIGDPQTIPATAWLTETTSDMNITLNGLTPETPYEAQVQSECNPDTIWSSAVTFTTPVQTTLTQTITLASGANYCSFYVEITLNELKAALVATYPSDTISIKSKNSTTTYNPRNHRWTGSISDFNVGNMYKVITKSAGEITLEGMPVDPANHPVTIKAGNNYIAFPFNTTMTLTNAFAGFAVNGDKIKSKNNTCAYTRGRWGNAILNLEPGQGYIYIGTDGQADRTLVFPSSK